MEKWHYAGRLSRGKECFGAFYDGILIGCTVFDNAKYENKRITEFMAHARDPSRPQKSFQVSQLLAYSRKQLVKDYDLIFTHCEGGRKGSVFKGDHWNYNGQQGQYEEYWKPLSPDGLTLACELGLKTIKYIK